MRDELLVTKPARFGCARSKALLKKFPNHADRLARLTIEGKTLRGVILHNHIQPKGGMRHE